MDTTIAIFPFSTEMFSSIGRRNKKFLVSYINWQLDVALFCANEVLRIAVGQKTAKLQAVKVRHLKKSCYLARVEPNAGGQDSRPARTDDSQSLTDHNIAAL